MAICGVAVAPLAHLLVPAGMRERLLGDPGFPVKLSIEVGIGITMKLLAEISKRGDNFSSEIDFVFANVVMALIADTMLVWLPAPRASLTTQAAAVNQTAIARWLKSCPDNAFQVSHTPRTWWHKLAIIWHHYQSVAKWLKPCCQRTCARPEEH